MLGGLCIRLTKDELARLQDRGFQCVDDLHNEGNDELQGLATKYRLWSADENLQRHLLVDASRFTSSAAWNNRLVTYKLNRQALDDLTAAKEQLQLSGDIEILMCLGWF